MVFIKMTLRDAYNYDNTIFNPLDALPEGLEPATAKTHIVARGGGRYVAAFSIDILRLLIKDCVATKLYDWERMLAALRAEYSPVENVMEHTEFTDTETTTNDGKSNNVSTSSSNGTSTAAAAAYDSGTMKDTGKQVDTAALNGTNDTTVNNKTTREFVHTQDRHGNIGVTSNQQMITQEMIMRKAYNIYDIIADDIINATTLEVY